MEIKGKIYCFFEQSGTFKNEFRKLGYEAEDYDIQNEYGETDHICDLFAEIEAGYDGKPSIFDEITPDDLVLAFFPCIYFTGFTNPRYYTLDNNNYVNLTMRGKFDTILRRADNRNDFYKLLYKMIGICIGGGRGLYWKTHTLNFITYTIISFASRPSLTRIGRDVVTSTTSRQDIGFSTANLHMDTHFSDLSNIKPLHQQKRQNSRGFAPKNEAKSAPTMPATSFVTSL